MHYDSEGDAELHFRIEEHLANCLECTEWFFKQGRLENLLVGSVSATSANRELWNRVLDGAGVTRRGGSRRVFLATGVAVCAATVLLGIFLADRFSVGVTADLIQSTGDWHDRLAAGNEPLDFHSQSDLEIEDYLRSRVSFPVRCPPRKDSGFEVQGAGIRHFADHPAAYLAGRIDATPVSIFVMPSDSLADLPNNLRPQAERQPIHTHVGQYDVVLSLVDRNAVLVVGKAERASLDRLISAYGTYPHQH
ncbi:MAG: hypothetical protein AB7L90_26540 [Hyphomicrobiaceae bacterium]